MALCGVLRVSVCESLVQINQVSRSQLHARMCDLLHPCWRHAVLLSALGSKGEQGANGRVSLGEADEASGDE